MAIVEAFKTAGMANIGDRAVYKYEGPGNWADVTIGSGMKQKVIAHEAGHMFGMKDEYVDAGPSSAEVGKEVDPKLREKTGVPAKVGENSDSIMSVGGKVKTAHHAPFIEALQKRAASPSGRSGRRRRSPRRAAPLPPSPLPRRRRERRAGADPRRAAATGRRALRGAAVTRRQLRRVQQLDDALGRRRLEGRAP